MPIDPMELLALAEARAAMQTESWIPEKKGDRVAGICTELGTIHTANFGDYYTTTLQLPDDYRYIENGESKSAAGKEIRVAWMGAVLVATFNRLQPRPGDLIAFHFQDVLTPQNGMNDYKLVVAAVIDPATGKAKIPVDLTYHVPTPAEILSSDPRTGELGTVDTDLVRTDVRGVFPEFTEENEKLAEPKKPAK